MASGDDIRHKFKYHWARKCCILICKHRHQAILLGRGVLMAKEPAQRGKKSKRRNRMPHSAQVEKLLILLLSGHRWCRNCFKQAADRGHKTVCTVLPGGDVKYCQDITAGIVSPVHGLLPKGS